MVGDPPCDVELVGRPSRRSGSGRQTRPEVRYWLGDLLTSGTGRETLLEVRKWLGDTPGGPVLVGRTSLGPELVGRPPRRSGTGRETLSEVQKWLGDPPGDRKWSETHPEVWNWSGDPLGGLELVGRPSQRSKSSRENLTEVWNW